MSFGYNRYPRRTFAFRAFNLGSFSFTGKSFVVTSQDTEPQDLFLKPDGTKMFVIGSQNGKVYQYSLSTAFDISTASFDSKEFLLTSQDAAPVGLWFKPDGTKMYMFGAVTDDVFQYTLSTAFDVSTASFDSKSFSFTAQDTGITGGALNEDGTKLYAVGITTNDRVYQYTLSTPFDVSTASFDNKFLDFFSEAVQALGMFIGDSGNKVFIAGRTADSIFQYSLTDSDDVSTASFDGFSLDISDESTVVSDVHMSPNGGNLYITDRTAAEVFQYSV